MFHCPAAGKHSPSVAANLIQRIYDEAKYFSEREENMLCLIPIFLIYGAAGLCAAGAENGQEFSYLWAALILGMCLQAVKQEFEMH